MASGSYDGVSEFLGQLGGNTSDFLGQLGGTIGRGASGALNAVDNAAGFMADKNILNMPGLAERYRAKKEGREFRSASERGDVMKFNRPKPSEDSSAPFRQPSHPSSKGEMPDVDITPTDVLKATYTTGKAVVQGGKQGLAAIAPAALAAQKAGSKKTNQIANAVDQATGKPTKEGESADPMQDAIDKVRKYYRDPEYEKFMNGQESRLSKQKKEDVWTTLAQIGFGMAASKSPTLLGAIGEAGSAAMPNAMKALQARRAAEGDLAKQRMETRRAEVTAGIGVAQSKEELQQKKSIADMEQALGIAKMHSDERIAQGNQSATRFAASQRQPSAADVMRENVDEMTQAFVLDPNNARRYYLDPSKFNDPKYMQRQDVQVAYRRLMNAGREKALTTFYTAQGLGRASQAPTLLPGTSSGGGNEVTDFSGLN
jgi:O6-methylguanine-DNA--protein-cysteine methyltransferase